MFQPIAADADLASKVLWQFHWSDGSRLELTETNDNYILIEYDPNNNPIPYLVENVPNPFPSIEERYPKRKWKLRQVLDDISEEYDLFG